MVEFDYRAPGQIVFGTDAIQRIPDLVRDFPKKVLLITGKDRLRAGDVEEILKRNRFEVFSVSIIAEPTDTSLTHCVSVAQQDKVGWVIAVGGGSVIDSGKIISVMINNPGKVIDYVEIIGAGKPLERKALPFIAVPTTAGTGTEVTKNAVIRSLNKQVKISMRDEKLIPRIAVIDPKLTMSMTPELTAQTGLDALTQLLEAYTSKMSNPFTNMVCREGLSLVSRSFLKAFDDGMDIRARSDMALAAMYSGMALANAKLGAVHGIAGPLGGMFPIPHGAACAALLPYVIRMNVELLQNDGDHELLCKYDDAAGILCEGGLGKLLAWLDSINQHMNIKPLSKFGVGPTDIRMIAMKASQSSSMKGNPVELTLEQIEEIIYSAI